MVEQQSLTEYLSKYKNLEVATIPDNEDILDFLANVPMESDRVSLRYDRSPDFFRLLKEQASFSYVIKILNKDKTIGGIGVFTVRKAWENGKLHYIGYTSDLRISPTLSMRSRVQWRNGYASIIKDFKLITEFKNLTYFYTAILDDNERALRSFTKGDTGFSYQKVSSYRSLNIFGKKPFSKQNKYNRYEFSKYSKKELISFLSKITSKLSSGYYYNNQDNDESTRREKEIMGYNYDEYLVIKDEEGDIISCCYPFHTSESRNIIIDKMDVGYKMLTSLSPFYNGKKLKTGESLRILYFTDLQFDESLTEDERAHITLSYINYLSENKIQRNFHLITILDFYNEQLTSKLKLNGHLVEEKKATLYQVLHTDHIENNSYYKIPKQKEIGFELALA
jgi:hypothetical protein